MHSKYPFVSAPGRNIIGMTPNEATLIGGIGGAALGAIFGGVTSIFTTRYLAKHGPNYSAQIDSTNDALAALAATQEEMRKQHATAFESDKEHREKQGRIAEAAQWKPRASMIAVNEGQEHVNKLSIMSVGQFILREVYLLSDSGARVYKFPQTWGCPCVAINVAVPHRALTELAGKSVTYGVHGWFDGILEYTIEKVGEDPIPYTGELKFRATTMMLGNTQWFDLAG
jgi:hypothetical protein